MRKEIVKSVTSALLCFWLIVFSAVLSADWKIPPGSPTEVGLEMEIVSVLVSKKLKGTLTGKVCEECELIQVRITPQTVYFERPDKRVALLKARSLTGKGAVLVYNVKSMEAIKLVRLVDAATHD